MEKEDFKYDRTKQMAMKYLKKMTEDETGDNTVNEWEIIPYETLWEKVLNRLPKQSSSCMKTPHSDSCILFSMLANAQLRQPMERSLNPQILRPSRYRNSMRTA